MREIKKIIMYFLIFMIIIPIHLNAKTYNDSVKIANNYMNDLIKNNSYNRYLIMNTNDYYVGSNNVFINGGLLSYKEFLITVNNNNPSTSYLYNGIDYWTYTKSNKDNNFVVSRTINHTKNNNNDKTNVKVTQYIKDDISVSGSGTIQNPWQFVSKYNIVLDKTGGSGGPDRVSVFYLNKLPQIDIPSRNGYKFEGYYTGLNGTGNQYYQSDGKSDIPWDKKSDSILYAKWKPNKVNIKFHVGKETSITSQTGSNYWRIGSNGNIYNSKDSINYTDNFWSREYNSKIDLPNYNNSGYINITKLGYTGVPGKQWCTDPNRTGVCYDQNIEYDITTFCPNITTSDCNIQLYMNWKISKITYSDIAINYRCGNVKVGSPPYIIDFDNKCQLIDEGNGNWKIKFLESGNLIVSSQLKIDAFLVGGGGGGGGSEYNGTPGSGGGGGFTKTVKNITLNKSQVYKIIIGQGGDGGGIFSEHTGKKGNATEAFGASADGGNPGCGKDGSFNCIGGTGGNNGGNVNAWIAGAPETHGKCCSLATREFGEESGDFYAGGGGAAESGQGGQGGGGNAKSCYNGTPGEPNTGGGGSGGTWFCGIKGGAKGGSGIVVIRNKR